MQIEFWPILQLFFEADQLVYKLDVKQVFLTYKSY